MLTTYWVKLFNVVASQLRRISKITLNTCEKTWTLKKLNVGLWTEVDEISEKNGFNPIMTKVNIVEHIQTCKTYKNKLRSFGGKGSKMGLNGGVFKMKFQGKYYNDNKVDHKSLEYRVPTKKIYDALHGTRYVWNKFCYCNI